MARGKLPKRLPLKRCNRTGLVIFEDKIAAKTVLAKRIKLDRGEDHIFKCVGHYHLSRPLTQGSSSDKITT